MINFLTIYTLIWYINIKQDYIMLPLAVDRFWDEKSLAASHSHRFGYFVCSTALRPLTFKWGNYLFVLDCTMLYSNILIYTCIQLCFSILNKICDMRVTSPGCFDMECLTHLPRYPLYTAQTILPGTVPRANHPPAPIAIHLFYPYNASLMKIYFKFYLY